MAALLLVSPALLAQMLSFGVRAAVPMTDLFRVDSGRQTSTERYTFGPTVNLDLCRGAAIGADFLFQSATLAAVSASTVRRWELPLSLVYRLRPSPPHPFVRAGVSLNRVFDTGSAVECARGPFGEQFYCLDGKPLAELRHRVTYGPVIGGGLQFRVKRMRIDAEVRLTRWVDRNLGVRGGRRVQSDAGRDPRRCNVLNLKVNRRTRDPLSPGALWPRPL
jgi:hypothetical protein